MNLSGRFWAAALRYCRLPPEVVVVVVDDVALPLRAVRVRAKGNAGGHNGLQSVAGAFGGGR